MRLWIGAIACAVVALLGYVLAHRHVTRSRRRRRRQGESAVAADAPKRVALTAADPAPDGASPASARRVSLVVTEACADVTADADRAAPARAAAEGSASPALTHAPAWFLRGLDRQAFDELPLASPPATLPGHRLLAQDVLDRAIDRVRELSDQLFARQQILSQLQGASLEPVRLAQLVTDDPALAAQVLRTVNSSYYGLLQPVGSLFRAVLFLGHIEIRNIIWRACVAESVGSNGQVPVGLIERVWEHAFSASRTAYALAQGFGVPRPDEVSTAALLHDIGKLFALHLWPAEAVPLFGPLRYSDAEALEREVGRCGVGHARLGAEVVRAWGLPAEMALAVAYHHAPAFLPPEAYPGERRTLSILHAASLLTHLSSGRRRTGRGLPWRPQPGWLESLGVQSVGELLIEPVVDAMAPPSGEASVRLGA